MRREVKFLSMTHISKTLKLFKTVRLHMRVIVMRTAATLFYTLCKIFIQFNESFTSSFPAVSELFQSWDVFRAFVEQLISR